MKDYALIDKKAYHLAKDYFPAQGIKGVTARLIEKYLNPFTLSPKPTSKEGIYQRILESAQNANMKAGVIGRAIDGVVIRDTRAERAQNTLIIISMQSLHERPL